MKILVYNHDGTRFKKLLENNSVKLDYTDLSYSSSLEGLGSCSFKLPKSDPTEFIGKNYFDILDEDFIGLERIFLQDDNGDIVWGGINNTFDGDTDSSQIKCKELKSYFSSLKCPFSTATGNGLVAINSILATSGSTITLHDDSNIVDDIDIKLSANATVYDAIKSIIEGTYSRWILVHEKIGDVVQTKLLCRSIIGVSPAGVGLDRSKDSLEVDADGKRYFIYDEVNTERTNILNYKASQKHDSVVSNCIVQYKDISGVQQVAQSMEPVDGETHNSPSIVNYYYGKKEKVITSLEIRKPEHAQALANREVQFPDTSIKLTLYPQADDDIFVGDRVDFQIFSGGFITSGIDEDGNFALVSSRFRIQDKTVRVGDGTLSITLTLSARNTVPYNFSIFEKIGETRKDTRNLNSNIISG